MRLVAPPGSRAFALAGLVACLGLGCTPTAARPPDPGASVCEATTPGDCERRLVLAFTSGANEGRGDAVKALATATLRARAARDPKDPWVLLGAALEKADHASRSVVVREAGVSAVATRAPVVDTPALPATSVKPDALLLALAGAAGYEHVVWITATATGARELFPVDPLGPWLGGLLAAVNGDPARVEEAIAAEAAIRAAFAAACAGRYREAAEAAGKLAALVDGSDRSDEAAVRRRFALQTLGAAGLVLDADEARAASFLGPSAPSVVDPPPRPDDTPYGSYLRVLTARDERAAAKARAGTILAGVGEDRREAFAAMLGDATPCASPAAPPMEDARDLVFATRLAAAFPADVTKPPGPGQLSVVAWRTRYQRLVELVERAHLGWAYLPSLLAERGEALGVSLADTDTYRRVTQLGLDHLAASRELQAASPGRYRASTQVALVWSPGALSDERLRGPLVELTEASVVGKISATKTTEGLVLAVAAGVAAAVSYPPAVRETQLRALVTATEAKLRDGAFDKTGWSGALLFAVDGAYRLAIGQRVVAARAFGNIEGSLAPLAHDEPVVAGLGLAASAMVALGLDGKLVDPRPARRSGGRPRAGVDAAPRVASMLAALGPREEQAPALSADVEGLVLGLGAVVAEGLEAGAAREPAKTPACGSTPSRVALDGRLRDRLSVLADLRRRIVANPRYREGDGVWIRRVRLVVTAMSDALDLAVASDAALRAAGHRRGPVFTIASEAADRVLADALREVADRPAADLVSGLYGLLRKLASGTDPELALVKRPGDLKRVARGLFGLVRADRKGQGLGVALLDKLDAMPLDVTADADLVTSLGAYASAFYVARDPDRGDLCLLGALLTAGLGHAKLPPAVLDLAQRSGSRVAWMARFSEEVHKALPEQPDPATYAAEMKRATDDACQPGASTPVVAIMGASVGFARGRRAEAKATLDRALEDADRRGLTLPRMKYRYEERTGAKVFAVNLDLSFGSGLLHASNGLSLGLGFQNGGEPGGALSATLAAPDAAEGGEDAARLYVTTAALATVYHLLDHEPDQAVASASRAVLALTSGVKLGARAIRGERSAAWAADAHASLAVAAQLAAESGQPFLAGDLWTVLRQSFEAQSPPLDARAIARVLDDLPVGLREVPELAPVLRRARRSLELLAARAPCGDAKPDVGRFEEASCEAYPLAVSLRIADVLKKLPRLKRGRPGAAGGPACGAYRSLDTFLASAGRGAYDPDAFTRAVEDLEAADEPYDAAILLARHRRPSHCSAAIVRASRALAANTSLSPGLRADLHAAAFNCANASVTSEVLGDLRGMDEATKRLADPTRNLQLALSLADFGVKHDRWAYLAKLVEEPDFLTRWQHLGAIPATWALLLHHAALAIEGRPVAASPATREARDLVCETFRSHDRAELCATIDALASTPPPADAAAVARQAVKALLASVTKGP